MQRRITRRVLIGALTSAALLPPSRSHAIAEKLEPSDPQAKALGYVDDAALVSIKQFPNYRQGQSCANCALVQIRYGPMRPCKIFPGKLVRAKGWCSAWAARTFDS